MDTLAKVNLTETGKNDKFLLGRELVKSLIDFLNYRTSCSKTTAFTITPKSIGILAGKLLNVEDGDEFVDFASGAGLSTIEIIGNKKAKIFNAEIHNESRTISAMLYIMNGYNDFEVVDENIIAGINRVKKADKIFIDAPLGLKIEVGIKKYDSTYLTIERAMESLNEKGIAFITCAGKTLFAGTHPFSEQRERLIENGYIKAVISLPACWQGTSISTNILVLSKIKNDKVTFVNATTNNIEKFFIKDVSSNILTTKGIETIADIVNNGKEIEGISKLVSKADIEQKEYNLVPTMYVVEKEEEETRSLNEIDNELASLYAKLLQ